MWESPLTAKVNRGTSDWDKLGFLSSEHRGGKVLGATPEGVNSVLGPQVA
jgi:hypothetical protein